MERTLLGVTLRDGKPNLVIRGRSGLVDVIERITTSKWNWAGHVAKARDGWWTKRILEWRPQIQTKRNQG